MQSILLYTYNEPAFARGTARVFVGYRDKKKVAKSKVSKVQSIFIPKLVQIRSAA